MKDITVLITAAGNMFMPGTTACLKENGERNIRLIGADMNDDPTMLQMVDAYYQVPRGDDPSYVDVIFNICKKEKVDVVLPVMSVELNVLSLNKNKFENEGIRISVSDSNSLFIANDKLALFNYMRDNGLPCAEYRSVSNINSLKEAVHELGYPKKRVCVKATNVSGSRGFRILDSVKSRYDMFFNEKPNSAFITLDDLLSIMSENEIIPEMMVMEYLPGAEYTVDLLADHGEVLYSCCRKSTNMENSIMLDGIVSDNKEVLELCRKVTEKLRLDGNIGFDVKEREDGTPMIMECNPRITAGISAFAAAGVNLPYLCVKKLLGEELPRVELKIGLKMKRRYCEMYC